MTPTPRSPVVTVREIDTPGGIGRAHIRRPTNARGTVALSHGAGGGLHALDLTVAQEVFLADGWACVLVEQPWLVAERKIAGRPDTLDAAWVPIVTALMTGRGKLPRPLVVGGRSAGARVACRTAGILEADAALLLSFPLHLPVHPRRPGRPDKPVKLRAHELALAPDPTWLVQATGDPFGTPDELRVHLPPGATMLEVPGAHSFAPGARSALTRALSSAAEGLAGMQPT